MALYLNAVCMKNGVAILALVARLCSEILPFFVTPFRISLFSFRTASRFVLLFCCVVARFKVVNTETRIRMKSGKTMTKTKGW